jgi:hypothetical protein
MDLLMAENDPPAYIKAREKAIDLKTRILEKVEKGEKVTAKSLKAEDMGKLICQQLNGEVTPDGFCVYKEYENVANKYRVTMARVPLAYMDDLKIKQQYRPDKQTYLDFCAEVGLDPEEVTLK